MTIPVPKTHAPEPTQGLRRFSAGDIVTLLRVNFFSGVGWRPLDAIRMVAIIALMVLGRVGTKPLLRMKRKDWRPDGRDVMVITSRRVTRVVPVVPALRAAVERYLITVKDKRPDAPLLQTASGRAQAQGYFGKTFANIDRHLGLGMSSKVMFRRFCSDMLCGDEVLSSKEQVVLDYFERGNPDVAPADAPIGDILALFSSRDPFKGGLERAIGSDGFARQLAHEIGTSLPDRIVTQSSQKGTTKKAWLPDDHPLVVWLRSHPRCSTRPERAAKAVELFEGRREELLAALESGALPKIQLVQLLHISRFGLRLLIARAGMDEPERAAHRAETGARYPRPRRRRPRSTADDRAYIEAVKSLCLADRGPESRDQAIRGHFPKAVELLNRRVLTSAECGDLFGISKTDVSLIRQAFPPLCGLKTDAQRRRYALHVRLIEIVRREWDTGPARETDASRFLRLSGQHGFQLGRRTMLVLRKFAVRGTTIPGAGGHAALDAPHR